MRIDQAFQMSDRGRFQHQGPGHGRHRPDRAWPSFKVGDEIEIVGLHGDTWPQDRRSPASRCSTRRSIQGHRRRQRGRAAPRRREERALERGHVLAKPEARITPHTKFNAQVYVLTKEEGGRHYAVLQRVPAAVLLPDHGRDWLDRLN